MAYCIEEQHVIITVYVIRNSKILTAYCGQGQEWHTAVGIKLAIETASCHVAVN